MIDQLNQKITMLRSRSINLQKWIELAKSNYGALLSTDLKEQLSIIRAAYGKIDLTLPGHDLAIAQLQSREQEKVEFIEFLANVEKDKKFIDTKIKECESRIQQLNSASKRRSDDVIEPDQRERK